MHPSSPSHRRQFSCLHPRLSRRFSGRLQRIALIASLFCLLAALLPLPVAAQLAPQRQWVVFRQADGLLANDIFSILVHDNAIWFGTALGVNRFDGRWQSFPLSLIIGESSRQAGDPVLGAVTAMTASVDGKSLWIGTDHGYVAQWDGDRWQFAASLGVEIDSMVHTGGTLWIATDQGLTLLEQGLLREIPDLAGRAIHDIAVDDSGVWLAADHGLWRSTLTATELERVNVPVIEALELDAQNITDLEDADISLFQPWAGPIEALWNDGDGSLWLGSGAVVAQYNLKLGLGRLFRPFEDSQTTPVIMDITGTPGERVLIASAGSGVAQYLLDDGLLAAASNLGRSADGGLDTDIVRGVAIDQDNTLWFASPVGVFRYQQWAWQETDARLEGLLINDVLYDGDGALWIATGGEGIQRRVGLYANPDIYYSTQGGLPSDYVYDLEEDSRGDLWAATADGLAVHRMNTWRLSKATTLLPSRTVQALQADEDGVWIGTSAGLAYSRYDTDSVRNEQFFDGKSIVRIVSDGLGTLWVIAADGGLWAGNMTDGWRDARRMGLNAPLSGAATALLPDPTLHGAMYVAFSDAGIYRWSGAEWADYDRDRWPTGDRIEAMALDQSDNSLWIGSDIGLSRLDNLHLTTYDSHDGMQNGAIRAIIASPQGGQWFGGQKGLSFYQGERTPPWIKVDTLTGSGVRTSVDGWRIYAGRTVQVNYTTGDIQAPPDKLTVFYRLNRPGTVEPWRVASASPLALRLESLDNIDLELMVRDQAFNYSQSVVERLNVVAPPTMVDMPLLGEVERRVFQILLAFGLLAILGFGYVSFEILHRRRRVAEAINRGFNPYISGEPVRREEMFYARYDLLDRIVSTLHNNSIMIHGERRIGKTTLLYQLANALRQVQDSVYWFVPVLIDLEGTVEGQLFLQLGEDIYQEVACLPGLSSADAESLHQLICHHSFDAAAGGVTAYTDREFCRDLRTIMRVLEQYCQEAQAGRQVRLILLLDEVDTLSHFNHIYQQQLRRIFMRDFAATLGAVVAGIAISKEWDRIESPWYNLFNEIAMQPFSRSEAIDLLVEPVRNYYMYEPAALSFILDHSDGRPYRIQQYAMEAVNHMLKSKRRRILLADVMFAHGQILATTLSHGSASQSTTNAASGPNTDLPAALQKAPQRTCERPADAEQVVIGQALRQWIGG